MPQNYFVFVGKIKREKNYMFHIDYAQIYNDILSAVFFFCLFFEIFICTTVYGAWKSNQTIIKNISNMKDTQKKYTRESTNEYQNAHPTRQLTSIKR